MKTCFFCGQEFGQSPGTLLNQVTCGACFTMKPTEMQWEIYHTFQRIRKHKYKLGEPERKRKAAEVRAERKEERTLTMQEMTPRELEEFYGQQGTILNALRTELAALPSLPEG